MSNNIRTVRLRRLQGRLGDLAYELTRVHFAGFRHPERHWQPALNAYRCEHGIQICVDLAGVDPDHVELRLEADRLLIRGRREMPAPAAGEPRAIQTLAMEIEHGEFERQVQLPCCVDVGRVRAEHRRGFLWIDLPLRPHA